MTTNTASTPGVLSFEKAAAVVLEFCRQIGQPPVEEQPILRAGGRILAEPVRADRDFPPFPRATRDGYALRSADIQAGGARLRVVGQIKAGAEFAGTLSAGETAEIMTGAAVPSGADAVVMVEYTRRDKDFVSVERACSPGENVVAAGSEARAGQEMLPRGIRLGFAQVAVAAAVGRTEIRVYRQPRVAILSTGDELVEAAGTPGPFQIRNSNSYSLAAQTKAWGGEPVQLPIAPDDESELKKLIEKGLDYDLLLLSGGVSMGKFDLVEQVLQSLEAKFFFTGAEIQPGRPVVFGEILRTGTRKPFFGLPGNPVSTMVTFDLFVRPVLEALSGAVPVRLPTAKARLAHELKTKTGLTRFLPAVLQGTPLEPEVKVVSWQGSGDLMASAQANCYVVVPPDKDSIAAGEMIAILMRSCPN